MTVKSVRLNEDAKAILDRLVKETGLSASAVLRQGLLALRDQQHAASATAYEIYEQLDLGPGGYARAP